jgi:PEP-CTERM motif
MGKTNSRILSGAGMGSLLMLGFGVLGFTGVAQASILLPGQVLAPTGTASVSGPVLADTGAVPFIGLNAFNVAVFTGTVDTQVISDSGGLDFVYQFTNSPNSVDSIQRLTASDFTGFTTDADYIAGSGAAGPFLVTRSSIGDVIGFTFLSANPINPGQTSDILTIKTNATSFGPNPITLSDGGSGSAPSFAPVAVPEPASAAVAILGFGAMAMRRRKNRA